jgi:hypothetical protein
MFLLQVSVAQTLSVIRTDICLYEQLLERDVLFFIENTVYSNCSEVTNGLAVVQ